jgi:hypothetical protein
VGFLGRRGAGLPRRLRRRYRSWARNSLLPIPCAYLLLAIVLGVLGPTVDRHVNTRLAFDEIRGYGAHSVQVCRRLRAALEDRRASAAPVRREVIDEHLARLNATTELAFAAGSADLAVARGTDRMGLGRSRT